MLRSCLSASPFLFVLVVGRWTAACLLMFVCCMLADVRLLARNTQVVAPLVLPLLCILLLIVASPFVALVLKAGLENLVFAPLKWIWLKVGQVMPQGLGINTRAAKQGTNRAPRPPMVCLICICVEHCDRPWLA